jgi:hypothetical protein
MMRAKARRRRVPGENRDTRRALEQLLPRCPGCGNYFGESWPGQRFCRPSCRVRAERRERGELDGPPDLFSEAR